MTQTDTDWRVVPFDKSNGFHPPNSAYFDHAGLNAKTHLLPVISNPKGIDCDMARPHAKDPDYVSPYDFFFRFSFGPLLPETFESDIALIKQVLDEYRADVAA